jgi:hypothetical protein
MPAQDHLSLTAAMKKDDSRTPLALAQSRRKEELAMKFDTVGRRKDHLLWSHKPCAWELGRNSLGNKVHKLLLPEDRWTDWHMHIGP